MPEALRKHIEEIIPLTNKEFEYVLSFFTPRTFKKHQFLVQEGNMVPNDFFIVSGLVKASCTGEDNKQHILQFAMENWWVSDYQAYFHETTATLNVDCLEDTQVLCISLENRERLCAEMHSIERFFRKKSTSGFLAQQRRVLTLLNNNAKERYELLLKQYPTLFQRVSKTLIASYLGVSRETLSRLSS